MMSKLQGSAHVRVQGRVTLENLNKIVEQIVNMAGCPHCGLQGIDLRLSGDPVEAEQILKIPGVNSVGFGG
jgi:hypothetical protein